jgi:hypothetical protein
MRKDNRLIRNFLGMNKGLYIAFFMMSLVFTFVSYSIFSCVYTDLSNGVPNEDNYYGYFYSVEGTNIGLSQRSKSQIENEANSSVFFYGKIDSNKTNDLLNSDSIFFTDEDIEEGCCKMDHRTYLSLGSPSRIKCSTTFSVPYELKVVDDDYASDGVYASKNQEIKPEQDMIECRECQAVVTEKDGLPTLFSLSYFEDVYGLTGIDLKDDECLTSESNLSTLYFDNTKKQDDYYYNNLSYLNIQTLFPLGLTNKDEQYAQELSNHHINENFIVVNNSNFNKICKLINPYKGLCLKKDKNNEQFFLSHANNMTFYLIQEHEQKAQNYKDRTASIGFYNKGMVVASIGLVGQLAFFVVFGILDYVYFENNQKNCFRLVLCGYSKKYGLFLLLSFELISILLGTIISLCFLPLMVNGINAVLYPLVGYYPSKINAFSYVIPITYVAGNALILSVYYHRYFSSQKLLLHLKEISQ